MMKRLIIRVHSKNQAKLNEFSRALGKQRYLRSGNILSVASSIILKIYYNYAVKSTAEKDSLTTTWKLSPSLKRSFG